MLLLLVVLVVMVVVAVRPVMCAFVLRRRRWLPPVCRHYWRPGVDGVVVYIVPIVAHLVVVMIVVVMVIAGHQVPKTFPEPFLTPTHFRRNFQVRPDLGISIRLGRDAVLLDQH